MGTSVPNLLTFSLEKEATISGVQIGPGATAFTLIWRLINAEESDLVKATNAPLVAA
jgi:hypothetical protein